MIILHILQRISEECDEVGRLAGFVVPTSASRRRRAGNETPASTEVQAGEQRRFLISYSDNVSGWKLAERGLGVPRVSRPTPGKHALQQY